MGPTAEQGGKPPADEQEKKRSDDREGILDGKLACLRQCCLCREDRFVRIQIHAVLLLGLLVSKA